MPDFQRHAICRAPAVEVFKILHDPARFPDWWEGTERVEGEGEGGDPLQERVARLRLTPPR